MELLGTKIRVLPFDDSDLDLFVNISTSSVMMEFVREPATAEEARSVFEARRGPWTIESKEWFGMGISDISSGEKIGNTCIKVIDYEAKIAEVGYMIKENAQGKGFASEALSLVKKYLFRSLEINKIVAYCSVKNTGSYKLLEKLNFIREGCLRQNEFFNGNYVDNYLYGLCKSDI